MRALFCRLAMIPVMFGVSVSGQAPPALSGTWAFVPDAAGAIAAFGQQVVLREKGAALEVTRTMQGSTVTIAYTLDGSETTSRMPGRLCEPDSGGIWTATREGGGVMLTMVGALPPGGGPRIKMNVRTALRLESSESLVVEVTAQPAGQAAPRISRSVYRRTGPPPDTAPVQMEKARATLAQLGWIAGTWVGTAGTSTTEERWTPPAGGSMQAVARTLRSGMMTGFEFLCIVERDGGVVYQAMPNGRMPATDFTATRVEVDTVTFENPAHDFPKMIRYTKRPDGSLEAVISGAGGQRSQTFVFARQAQGQ